MPERRDPPPKTTSHNRDVVQSGGGENTCIEPKYREDSGRAPILGRVRELENALQRANVLYSTPMPETLYTTRDLARLFGKANVTVTKECREAGVLRRGHAYLLTQAQADEILRRFEDKDRRRQEQRQLVRKQEEAVLPMVIFKKLGHMEQAVHKLMRDREQYYRVFWEYISTQEDFRDREEFRQKTDFNWRSEVRHRLGELQQRLSDHEGKGGVKEK